MNNLLNFRIHQYLRKRDRNFDPHLDISDSLYIILELNTYLFAIEFDSIYDIIESDQIVFFPLHNHQIEGFFHNGEEMIPIIDIYSRIMPFESIPEDSRPNQVIILQTSHVHWGFMIHRIVDIISSPNLSNFNTSPVIPINIPLEHIKEWINYRENPIIVVKLETMAPLVPLDEKIWMIS